MNREREDGLPIIDDRYETVKVIGDGGMGTVYLARHSVVGKPVAVKVMSLEAADHPGMFERFQLEAKAAALIAHPNIVECYDVGNTKNEGLPYLVFEYLEGSDLLEEMNGSGPMPIRRVLRIAKQVSSALAQAHAKGVIHRDLKPENVFLTFREDNPDQVKLLDFGISKFQRLGARNPTPQSPMSAGTPQYMAPEQFKDADAIDGRADVYALGVLMYRMLSGRTPHAHVPAHELADRIWQERPPSLRAARPDLPRPLVDLVERCLRTVAGSRPTMEDVHAELVNLVNSGLANTVPGEAVSTRLPTLDTPLPMAAEARPQTAPPAPASGFRTAFIGLGAGLVIGVGIYVMGVMRTEQQATRTGVEAAPPAPAPAPAAAAPAPLLVEPALPDTIAIAVVSTAPGAKVTYRGETFDLPIAIEIDRGEHPELIEVTAPTFQGRRYWITLDKPRRIVAKLKPGKGVVEADDTETKIALGEMVDPKPEKVEPLEPTEPPVYRARKAASRAAERERERERERESPAPPPAAAAPAPSAPAPVASHATAGPAPAPVPAAAVPAPAPPKKAPVLVASAAPARPAAPPRPVIVQANRIEGTRLAGTRQIALPKNTEQAMEIQGVREAQAVVKLCLSAGGEPTAVDVLRGTGFTDADDKITSEMRGWRYRPYLVDGKPVPVCTSVAFRYQIRN